MVHSPYRGLWFIMAHSTSPVKTKKGTVTFFQGYGKKGTVTFFKMEDGSYLVGTTPRNVYLLL